MTLRFNPTLVRLRPYLLKWTFEWEEYSFNPTLVRLRRGICYWGPLWRWSFNPTLVRLRLTIEGRRRLDGLMFQSHAGSIEAQPLAPAVADLRGFNPTLVRLRPSGRPVQPWRKISFQSHAGSIEAHHHQLPALRRSSWFQSHAGSIEAMISASVILHLLSFNPTLVRLRHNPRNHINAQKRSFNPTLVRLRRPGDVPPPSSMWRFQSHAGSIEASLSPSSAGAAGKGFNPTLVRLRHWRRGGGGCKSRRFQSHAGSIEAMTPKDKFFGAIAVSIPRWFD